MLLITSSSVPSRSKYGALLASRVPCNLLDFKLDVQFRGETLACFGLEEFRLGLPLWNGKGRQHTVPQFQVEIAATNDFVCVLQRRRDVGEQLVISAELRRYC